MVSTNLKNISQIGSFPQVGVKIKNVWNHQPVFLSMSSRFFCWISSPEIHLSDIFNPLVGTTNRVCQQVAAISGDFEHGAIPTWGIHIFLRENLPSESNPSYPSFPTKGTANNFRDWDPSRCRSKLRPVLGGGFFCPYTRKRSIATKPFGEAIYGCFQK